jgi:nucleoside-diphosphate-sugar epimerase
VASHVTREFLQRGYKVRGTVRDLEKSSWLIEDVFKSHAHNGDFELVSVPDLGDKDAFVGAVGGMSAIVHAASITNFDSDPNKVIPQTVAGATSILYAALNEPSVKEFVYTGSISAATMYESGINTHVERDTWNMESLKLAWAPPPYEPSRGMFVYNASKTEAEMAIWKFVADHNPKFSVNAIDPSSIMGEPLNKKHLETPYSYIKVLSDRNMDFLGAVPSSKSAHHYFTADS